MDKFLLHDDGDGRLIEDKAAELYELLNKVDIDALDLPYGCMHYFKLSHTTRLFFSIQTSAHLLYNSIKLTGKKIQEIVLMDYGAGVGTLFLLAKMIGCRQVIYNDHLEDWKKSAETIATAIGVQIDHYVVGDIHQCMDELQSLNIKCDIIASRNVLEHIYKLEEFYKAIHTQQNQAIVYSSTTANNSNPAAVLKHILWHKKWEKVYRGKRLMMIERQAPGMERHKMKKLSVATRGLAADDLLQAIDEYQMSGSLPDPQQHGTNTCDPSNGVWAEHLLSMDAYRKLINEKLFTVSFEPGFWDTHYSKSYKNLASKMLNAIIKKGGKMSFRLAPFIYVIARPK